MKELYQKIPSGTKITRLEALKNAAATFANAVEEKAKGADGALDEAAVLELGFLACAREHLRHGGRTLRRSRRFANCHCNVLCFRLLTCAVFSRVHPVFGRGSL